MDLCRSRLEMFNSSNKPYLQFVITKTWTCLHPNVGYFHASTQWLGCRFAVVDSRQWFSLRLDRKHFQPEWNRAATVYSSLWKEAKVCVSLNVWIEIPQLCLFLNVWWRWEETYSQVASWSWAWPTPRPSAGDGWPRSVAFLSDWPHWWPGLCPLCGWPQSCRVRRAQAEIPVYTGQCREACWETRGSASTPSGTDTKTLLVT